MELHLRSVRVTETHYFIWSVGAEPEVMLHVQSSGRSLSHVRRSDLGSKASITVRLSLQCDGTAAEAAALAPPTQCLHPLEDGGLVKVLWAEPEAELLMLSAAPPPSFMTPPSSARPPHPHITGGCTPLPRA